MESFRYVCLTYFAPYVLIAGPQAPFKTFDEFVAFAKAKPEILGLWPSGPRQPAAPRDACGAERDPRRRPRRAVHRARDRWRRRCSAAP